MTERRKREEDQAKSLLSGSKRQIWWKASTSRGVSGWIRGGVKGGRRRQNKSRADRSGGGRIVVYQGRICGKRADWSGSRANRRKESGKECIGAVAEWGRADLSVSRVNRLKESCEERIGGTSVRRRSGSGLI